ncbi:MAG TPA: hypothetical protein PLZ36_15480 [Armatimonadota bacterium]|nr:hypothetical protein [Armatimonadota bacterium]HOS42313.1 hypothetical protein [Armatimonadota bacterium]
MRYLCFIGLALTVLAAAEVPAWLVHDRTLVAVRPLMEGLGGAVDYHPATATAAITLGRVRHDLTMPTDEVTRTLLRQPRGTMIYPLRALQAMFAFNLALDARTMTMTVWSGDHRLTLRPRVVPFPKPASPGIHALIDAQEGWLIGGCAGGRWWNDDPMASHQVYETHYRRYRLTGEIGAVVGGRTHATEETYGITLSLSRPAPAVGDTLGLHAGWNAMPRLPVILNPDGPMPRMIARAVLRAHGLPNAPVRVT